MIYKFNQFTLDTDQFLLIAKETPVPVEPLVFDLLVYLIEHRNRVISRDELLDNLWKGKVVTSSALGARLKDVRKAVQDDGNSQKTIKTLHGRGYQFIAEVSMLTSMSSTEEAVASSSSITLPDKPSIVVLPFNNLSGDLDQDFFSDGITEDIITELSRFKTLFVIARNSAFRISEKNLDPREIGEALGVQYLVEGSVRRAGNSLRITAQLIESKTGNHIWAERYDRKLKDIFELQDEVVNSIVAVLPGRVQEDVVDRALRKPTENMKAYELMLQGKAYRDQLSVEGNAKARECCEKAIELDPLYARAYMYLSDSIIVDSWLGAASEETPGQALELARKAAKLDGKDVYIQDHLGFGYLSQGMWQEAEAQFNKTVAKIVNEAESLAWCGYAYLLLGKPEKARDIVLDAMRLDPLHPPTLSWILGQVYFFEQRYEEVIELLIGEALLNSLAHAFLAGSYAQLGRAKEAQMALDSFITARRLEFKDRKLTIQEDNIESLAGGFKKMWREVSSWEKISDGLKKAGLKDTPSTERSIE